MKSMIYIYAYRAACAMIAFMLCGKALLCEASDVTNALYGMALIGQTSLLDLEEEEEGGRSGSARRLNV